MKNILFTVIALIGLTVSSVAAPLSNSVNSSPPIGVSETPTPESNIVVVAPKIAYTPSLQFNDPIDTPWSPDQPDNPLRFGQVYSLSGHNYTLVSYSIWEWNAGSESPFRTLFLFNVGEDLDTFKNVFGPGVWFTYENKMIFVGFGFNVIFQDDQRPDPAFGFKVGVPIG